MTAVETPSVQVQISFFFHFFVLNFSAVDHFHRDVLEILRELIFRVGLLRVVVFSALKPWFVFMICEVFLCLANLFEGDRGDLSDLTLQNLSVRWAGNLRLIDKLKDVCRVLRIHILGLCIELVLLLKVVIRVRGVFINFIFVYNL